MPETRYVQKSQQEKCRQCGTNVTTAFYEAGKGWISHYHRRCWKSYCGNRRGIA